MCIVSCHDVFLQDHRAVLEQFTKVAYLNEVRPYSEGLSGAGVYLVSVKPTDQASNGSPGSFMCVLKLDDDAEIDNEIKYCLQAQQFLNGSVPQIFDQTAAIDSGGKLRRAVLLSLANNDTREPRSLRDILPRPHTPQTNPRIDLAVDAVAELLLKWNPPSQVLQDVYSPVSAVQLLEQLFSIGAGQAQSKPADHKPYNPCEDETPTAGSPMEQRVANLVRRLQCAGIIETDLETNPYLLFNGDPTPLLNPIYFAKRLTTTPHLRKLLIHPVLGWVHGDLHTANVLFAHSSTSLKPTLIDFAKGGELKPMLFDWLYLEFDLLYQSAHIHDAQTWRDWMRAVQVVTQRDDPMVEKPIHSIKHWDLPEHLGKTAHAIERLRTRMKEEYWADTHGSLLNATFWTCGFYVGLNYARKRVDKPSLAEIFRKYAALYYASHCLYRVFRLSQEPLPSSRNHSSIGPHKELFIEPRTIGDPSGVYVSATADFDEIVDDLRQLGRRVGLRNPDAQSVDDVIGGMRSKRYFLGLMGIESEERSIFDAPHAGLSGTDEIDDYTPTEIEAAGALALFQKPEDCYVLYAPGWPGSMDKKHPVVRHYHQKPAEFQRFTFRPLSDLKLAEREVRRVLMDWRVIDSPATINDEVLSSVPIPSLRDKLAVLTQRSAPVQVVRLKGADDRMYSRTIWRWLRTQIKAQDSTNLKYEAAEIKTEEHEFALSFIHNVLNALNAMRHLDDRGWYTRAQAQQRVFADVERALKKVNVYFTIPELRNREQDLARFCRDLSNHLAGKELANRVIILVEDERLLSIDNVLELSTSDLVIPRADFEAFVADTPDIDPNDFLIDHEIPDDVNWAETIFESDAELTLVAFLTRLREYANTLPHIDEKGLG